MAATKTIPIDFLLSTGTQMGGWFTKEMTSLKAFKGLRYRMSGLGGEVLRRLGASVVGLPGGEIVRALKSGAIDASEWVGPWNDMAIGLHQAAGYYYYPGFHEPGTAQTLGINRRVWESFTKLEYLNLNQAERSRRRSASTREFEEALYRRVHHQA